MEAVIAEEGTPKLPIWSASVLFVLLQFFIQLSSGVVIGAIMQDMGLTALVAGLLSSSLYLVYTSLQIPVGILFDKQSPRVLMALTAFICGAGCLLFAMSTSLTGLFIGRLLIGSGSAFAFVGYSHMLRQHFPLKQFAFLMGLSETIAFIATVAGMITMGEMLAIWGWRKFIFGCGCVGLFVAYACWHFIPENPNTLSDKPQYGKQLLHIIKNARAWINGLFVGLSFTIVTVFGALWAIPFIQVKLNTSLVQASWIGSMFFLGASVSCPLFGILSHRLSKRKPLIISSCLSTATLLAIVLYCPMQNATVLGLLLFIIGCCCGAYMLAFSIANELAPQHALSTCTGFTNTLAMLTAPLLQTFIGYLLVVVAKGDNYHLKDYQIALSILPLSLIIACILVIFLPEKQ